MNQLVKNSFIRIFIVSFMIVGLMTTMTHAANHSIDDQSMKLNIANNKTEDFMTMKHQISLQHITATYRLDIYVSKYGALLDRIVDQTTDTPGWIGNVWAGFKEEDGLSIYHGKTFTEIKNMPEPKGITIMGGVDETPIEIHQAILQLIKKLETEEDAKDKSEKAELAKIIYGYQSLYQEKDGDEYLQSSMKEFIHQYEKALSLLKENQVKKDEINKVIRELKNAADSLILAPVDWTRYKQFVKEAENILMHENEYTFASINQLRQTLKEVQDKVNQGGNKKSKVKELEQKLKQAIKAVIKKNDSKNRFIINAKIVQANATSLDSMANQFMKQQVLLIEKDGSNEYQIYFKKGAFQGITADIATLKHIENGVAIMARQHTTKDEYQKVFTINRKKKNEATIDILLGAKMGGPNVTEMPAVLKLDLTSKRAEGDVLENTNKEKLKAVIDQNQKIYQDVLAGEFKEAGSNTYIKIYENANKVYEDQSATQETVDQAERSLKQAKETYLVPKKVDDLGKILTEAENKKEKDYTSKSYQTLQLVIQEANQVWMKRFEMTNQELQVMIDKIQNAIQQLKQAGSIEEDNLPIPKDESMEKMKNSNQMSTMQKVSSIDSRNIPQTGVMNHTTFFIVSFLLSGGSILLLYKKILNSHS